MNLIWVGYSACVVAAVGCAAGTARQAVRLTYAHGELREAGAAVYQTALHVAVTAFCVLTWLSAQLDGIELYGGTILMSSALCIAAGKAVQHYAPDRVVKGVMIVGLVLSFTLALSAEPSWLREAYP